MIHSSIPPMAAAMSYVELQSVYYTRQLAKLTAVKDFIHALKLHNPANPTATLREAYKALNRLILPQEIPEYPQLAQALAQARQLLF